MCQACRYQASLTSGTIFHKTKTPLLKWVWLIYRMAAFKTGVSIAEMQRELEIKDYKTIWTMAHMLPWTHRLIAYAKAVVYNPLHEVSKKHLQNYLSEVCHRFNRRYWGQKAFHRLLNVCASTDTVTRRALMASAEQSQ